MSDWNPINEPIDRFLIGGHMTPGIGEIVGLDSPRKWEEREGPGYSGATVFYRGLRLSHFSIRFRLYTEVDWSDWNAFANVVAKPPFGKRARALDIQHPQCQQNGVRAIVIENVLAPVMTSDDGEYTAELKVIEFRMPKSAGAKMEGSQDAPVDPVEIEIEERRQEAQTKRDLLAAS